MPIRCLIVDDHTLFREGLRRVLESEGDLQVVGDARDGADEDVDPQQTMQAEERVAADDMQLVVAAFAVPPQLRADHRVDSVRADHHGRRDLTAVSQSDDDIVSPVLNAAC